MLEGPLMSPWGLDAVMWVKGQNKEHNMTITVVAAKNGGNDSVHPK